MIQCFLNISSLQCFRSGILKRKSKYIEKLGVFILDHALIHLLSHPRLPLFFCLHHEDEVEGKTAPSGLIQAIQPLAAIFELIKSSTLN